MTKSPIFVKYYAICKQDKSAFTFDDFKELKEYLYLDSNKTAVNLLFIKGQQALQIADHKEAYAYADRNEDLFKKYFFYEWTVVSNPVKYSDLDLEDVKLEDVKNGA